MPGQVAPVANEREGLLAYLAQMRYVLKLTAYGLTEDQLRTASTAGPLTIGGLIKHSASTEDGWIDVVLQQPKENAYEQYDANFTMADGETIDDLFAEYDRVAARTEKVVAGIADLGQDVPVDKTAPWNPKDVDNWSVRWVLLHLIQETARHTGHADIIREGIDGAAAFPLMAAAENWPDSPWMPKWTPKA